MESGEDRACVGPRTAATGVYENKMVREAIH
jgi:hypothetical protein